MRKMKYVCKKYIHKLDIILLKLYSRENKDLRRNIGDSLNAIAAIVLSQNEFTGYIIKDILEIPMKLALDDDDIQKKNIQEENIKKEERIFLSDDYYEIQGRDVEFFGKDMLFYKFLYKFLRIDHNSVIRNIIHNIMREINKYSCAANSNMLRFYWNQLVPQSLSLTRIVRDNNWSLHDWCHFSMIMETATVVKKIRLLVGNVPCERSLMERSKNKYFDQYFTPEEIEGKEKIINRYKEGQLSGGHYKCKVPCPDCQERQSELMGKELVTDNRGICEERKFRHNLFIFKTTNHILWEQLHTRETYAKKKDSESMEKYQSCCCPHIIFQLCNKNYA